MALGGPRSISAVMMARNRADVVGEVLHRLAELPIDEVVVVDNGSDDGTPEVVESCAADWEAPRRLELVRCETNVGVAARNVALRRARNDLVLLVDDDSYPLPGSIERLVAAFEANDRLAVAGGFVVEVDEHKNVTNSTEPGSFDWMLRAGAVGDPPVDGFRTYFFPEGAALARRDAVLGVGGFYEKFFFTQEGFELTARLLGAGWDVRYLPTAPFHHMKAPKDRGDHSTLLRLAVRNHLWYFWLRFPPAVAARRIPAYAAYDLLQAAYRGVPGAWWAGVRDAWREREVVRDDRAPLDRAVVRRAELRRGRAHLRLVLLMGLRLLRRLRP
ncbi:MAG TPA: glycosyltransferase family 2 protein [Acidimicrobiales bacterium]|nr:glycosyltransferase family 2 protein [Acidimicrobiales bacterium]